MAVTLSAADQALIDDYQKQWKAAEAAGNTQAMQELHNAAEGIRANNGFSGGADGSQYIPLGTAAQTTASAPSSGITPAADASGAAAQTSAAQSGAAQTSVSTAITGQPVTGTQTPSDYTPQGIYNDTGLSETDKAAIKELQKQWQIAMANGDTETANKLHEDAEKIRNGYGYSGGGDGSGYVPTNLTPGTPGYVAPGTYTGQEMSADDQAKLSSLQYQWKIAIESGDTATAKQLHTYAEAIRARYGFSGGEDGSQHLPLGQTQPGTGQTQPGVPPYTPGSYYNPAELPSATSAEQYIKDLYAAQQEAILQAYKTAYDANVSTLDAAAGKIPAQYQTARNQAAAQSEIQRASFNEMAAANGLSSGAGGQAQLAMGNQLQGDLSGISALEADALSDLELQRTQLATQYQNDIAQAIADGRLEEANALYGEYVRIDNSIVDTAVAQASLNANAYDMNNSQYNANRDYALQAADYTGDFSGMAAYGWPPSLIAAARQQWLENKNS